MVLRRPRWRRVHSEGTLPGALSDRRIHLVGGLHVIQPRLQRAACASSSSAADSFACEPSAPPCASNRDGLHSRQPRAPDHSASTGGTRG